MIANQISPGIFIFLLDHINGIYRYMSYIYYRYKSNKYRYYNEFYLQIVRITIFISYIFITS